MVDGPLFEDSQLDIAILGHPVCSTGQVRSGQITSLVIPAIPWASRGLNRNRVLILVVSERSGGLKGNPRGLCNYHVRGAVDGILLTKPPSSHYKSSWPSPFLPFGKPSFPFTPTFFLFIYFTPRDLFRHSLACPCLSRPILPSPWSCLRQILPSMTIRGFLHIVPRTSIASIHIPAPILPPTKSDIWYALVLLSFLPV